MNTHLKRKRLRAPGAGRKKGSGIASRIRPDLPVWKLRGALNYSAFMGTPGETVGASWMRLCADKQALEGECQTFGIAKLEAISWLLAGAQLDPRSGLDALRGAADRRARLESAFRTEPGTFRRGVELLGKRAQLEEHSAERRRCLVGEVELSLTRLDAGFFQSMADFVMSARAGKFGTEGRRYSRILTMIEDRVCCADGGLRLLSFKAVRQQARHWTGRPVEIPKCEKKEHRPKPLPLERSPVQVAALAAVTFLNSPPRCVKPLFTAREVYQHLAAREQGSGSFFRVDTNGEPLENNLRQVRKYCRALGVRLLRDAA